MTLFDSPEIMEQAKDALKKTIHLNLSKLLIYQRNMIKRLSSEKPLKHSKKSGKNHKKECEFCKLSNLLSEMSRVREIATEAALQYEYICGETFDLDNIFEKLNNKIESQENIFDENSNIVVPDDAPQEVKDMIGVLKNALKKNGMDRDVSMEVIDLKADNFGLKPEDFPDFAQYARAVSQARANFHAKNKDKSGEDVLNEAVINSVVNDSSKNSKEKLN